MASRKVSAKKPMKKVASEIQTGSSYADRYKKRYYDTEDKVYKSMWQSAILGKSTTPGLGRKTKEEMRRTSGDMAYTRSASRKRAQQSKKLKGKK